MSYYIIDEAGFVSSIYVGPGQPANSTDVPPPEDASIPLQFVGGAWVLATPANKFISLLAFFRRFTTSERLAVRSQQTRDPIIADFMMLVDASKYIDLADTDLQNGIAYLVSVHILTTERAAAIIGSAILDSERP